VGVPGTSFILGKHSGRHALGQRCKELGFDLDRRELDQVYRQFLAIADQAKTIEDRRVLEIIRAVHRGDSFGDVASLPQLPIPSVVLESAFDVAGAKVTFPHESEQQEDYLWGV
jgi:hypothetical protein